MDKPSTPELPRLWLSRDVAADWLTAIEFGRVDDGQPYENWRPLSENFAYLHAGSAGETPAIGFKFLRYSGFEIGDEDLEGIWEAPRFHVPQLGLREASAGEIALAALRPLGDESTLNRLFFDQAVRVEGEEAVKAWNACMSTGDLMASFGLGYTLFELGEFHRAYRHLRYYATIAPAQPWVHCWYGKAAAAIGESEEARAAYATAIELTEAGGEETDAPELLADLDARRPAA